MASLSQSITDSAERVCHAARTEAPAAAWSPTLTTESLSQAASCGTVISHHCDVLLRSLADRAAQHGSPALSRRLAESAQAAGCARAASLRAARAWYQITTDTRGTISPAAAESADLTLWTGRLAYANPAWTIDLGPSQPARPPEALAPEPRDLPGVVAAVHQACVTLTGIAAADHAQVRAAADAGRLHVPTRTLPESYDIPNGVTGSVPRRTPAP